VSIQLRSVYTSSFRCSSHAAYCVCAGQDRKGQGQGTLVGKLSRQGLLAAKFLDFPFVAIVEAEGEAAPEPSKRHRPLPTHGVQVDAHGVVALTKIGVMLKTIEGLVQLQKQETAIALIHDASDLVNDTIMKLQMPSRCIEVTGNSVGRGNSVGGDVTTVTRCCCKHTCWQITHQGCRGCGCPTGP
jgi:hypothetical protein